MTFKSFILGLGDAIQSSFAVIEGLNNNANVFFIITGILLFAWWMNKMSNDGKEAKRNGTLV
jgi:hypothetical protein